MEISWWIERSLSSLCRLWGMSSVRRLVPSAGCTELRELALAPAGVRVALLLFFVGRALFTGAAAGTSASLRRHPYVLLESADVYRSALSFLALVAASTKLILVKWVSRPFLFAPVAKGSNRWASFKA